MSGSAPRAPRAKSFRFICLCSVVAVVLGGIFVGLNALWQFAYTPGESASRAPSIRPSEFRGGDGRPLLVVFAHPRCSCTEATIEQLARLRAEYNNLDIRVFLFAPTNGSGNWTETALRKQAARIPGAQILEDRGGRIADQYGAATSGQAFLFDAAGHLAFSGGLTAFRDHYGDSDGADAVTAILRGAKPQRRTAPVFGCGLRSRSK